MKRETSLVIFYFSKCQQVQVRSTKLNSGFLVITSDSDKVIAILRCPEFQSIKRFFDLLSFLRVAVNFQVFYYLITILYAMVEVWSVPTKS